MPELFDVLFDDLRSSKNKVNRLLGAGLLFAMIAHFYVVEPYFEYKGQERKLSEVLSKQKTQFEQISSQFKIISDLNQKVSRTLNDVWGQIEGFPDHLHGMLPKIEDAISTEPPSQAYQQSMPARNEDLSLPPNIKTFDPAVRWYIETWFNDLVTRLKDEVVTPIIRVNTKLDRIDGIDGIDLHDINHPEIKNIQVYLDSVMKKNPNFWHEYSGQNGKVGVSHGLQNEVKKSFGLAAQKINELIESLEKAAKKQEAGLVKTENDIKKLQGSKEILNARLDSLESPFGRIPADLPDLIKLFPILMVGLIVFVTATIQKSFSLYAALWEEFKKDNGKIDLAVFQRQTDCWYLPPYPNIFRPLLLGALVGVFIGIFVRASLLVTTEPELFISLTGEAQSLKKNLFIGTYIAGALAILGCLWFIGKIFKR